MRNIENGRNSLTQGGECQFLFLYQVISPENMHTNNSLQLEQGVLMYLGHEFEREQGEQGQSGDLKRGGNGVIIFQIPPIVTFT